MRSNKDAKIDMMKSLENCDGAILICFGENHSGIHQFGLNALECVGHLEIAKKIIMDESMTSNKFNKH